MSCSDCRFWQGKTDWGDCYRYIAILSPDLLKCTSDLGQKFSIPFDPHDVGYFKSDSNFRRAYKAARSSMPRGTRSLKVGKHHYIQTEKDFGCEMETE